jgi:four helix bundle protein
MHIALKEANETKYWLRILHASGYIKEKEFESMLEDNKNIIGTLVNIIKSAKS